MKNLLVNLGGLTFDAEDKRKLRIPNLIAKARFIKAVLQRYGISPKSLWNATYQIGKDGNILPLMKFVPPFLSKWREISNKSWGNQVNWEENRFRDWFGNTFLLLPQLVPLLTFEVS